MLSLAVSADEPQTDARTFIPNPPKAKENFSPTQKCIEPVDIMRSNHGEFLKHHRDDTMHRGVRTIKYSLVACINCHVTKSADGNYPSIKKGSEHFCRSCHTYAAVSIDCFQCHASKPIEPFSR
ncbi:MAG: Hdr-like menaquinol oxidoreductase cytochrome c subunit [Candidatus Parabeggiatoa sp. nov. 1]|nr:MAG: Hdr-like menaquinol oxidoreductase cytochrome c subunit [Gammaproteobacteria bacterium]